jgi:hypothetical protein
MCLPSPPKTFERRLRRTNESTLRRARAFCTNASQLVAPIARNMLCVRNGAHE